MKPENLDRVHVILDLVHTFGAANTVADEHGIKNRDPDCPPLPAQLSWKDVLDEKLFGNLHMKAWVAVRAGYRYFIHNTLVYEAEQKDGYLHVYRHNIPYTLIVR